jgi:hypothetical protein
VNREFIKTLAVVLSLGGAVFATALWVDDREHAAVAGAPAVIESSSSLAAGSSVHGLAVRAMGQVVPGATDGQPEIGTAAPAKTGKDAREIDWLELMPEEDIRKLQELPPVDHSGFISAEQFMSFNTVPEMDNREGKIAGYIVPIDTNEAGELTEFFLVPYFGACVHVPPPPPNQIVYGKLETPIPIPDMFAPQWVEGTLVIEKNENELGASAYTMKVQKVTLWEG